MSKKNKNKYKFLGQSGTSENRTQDSKTANNPEGNLSYDMKKEFRFLAFVIIFILALLIGLYFYDKQTHVLQYLTNKFFSIINS